MRARRSLFAALFSLVALSAGVPADAQGLISFLPEKGVTLHLGSYDTAMSTAALLLNTSDADVPLSFQLGVFVDERGVPLDQPIALSIPDRVTVPARGTAAVPLTLQRGTADQARVSRGDVIAFDETGLLYRLPVETIIDPALDPGSAPGLDPLSSESLTLRSEAPLGVWDPWGAAVAAPALHVSDTYSQTMGRVGTLAGPEGHFLPVNLVGTVLTIAPPPVPGAYSGTIDLDPWSAQGQVAVTLQARAGWGWALGLLVVGLGLAQGLEQVLTIRRPRLSLEIWRQRLYERAEQRQLEAASQAPKDAPFHQQVLRIYDSKTGNGLLNTAASEVLANFDRSESNDERKRWRANGAEAERVAGYLDILRQLQQTAFAIAERLQSLKALDQAPGPLAGQTNIEQTPLFQQSSAALTPQLLVSLAALTARQADLQRTGAFTQAFFDLSLETRRLISQTKGTDGEILATHYLKELYSSAVTDVSVLTILSEDVRRLALQSASGLLFAPDAKQEGRDPTRRSWSGPTPLSFDLASLLRESSLAAPLSPPSSKDLEGRLRRLDGVYRIVAGAVVLASGLATLYFPNPTFGSMADLLGVLLWGTTVSGGFQLARQLWPASSVA